jgi:flagellar capping protein FliD
VIDGIEITLKGKTSGQVTVSASRDDDGIVAKVKSLVDAANSVLSTVSSQTASSTSAASRGTLAGDNAARQASDMVRNFVAKGIAGADGSTVPSSKLGISLTKEGTLSFDETALRSSLTTDAATVFNALGRGGSSNVDGVKVTNVTAAAVDGPRTVTITAAATQANMVGVPSPPPPAGATVALTVVTPTGSYSVSFTAGSSYAETAAHLTAALRGLGVKASASTTQTAGLDDGFKIVADKYGAGHSFSVSGPGAATLGLTNPATDGTDAQATITTNGVSHSYTASGQSLVKEGMALTFDLTPDQLATAGGSVTSTVKVTGGLAGGLSAIGAQGSTSGMVASAKDSLTTRISDLQTRISKWDDMLAKRQSTLEARFNNMQLVLTKLQSALSSSGIANLPTA